MQIKIDIPEDIYYDVFQYVECLANSDFELLMMRAIKNGVPLPKGHGRLIDADALGEELHRYTEAPYLYALKVFNDAPTVIKADEEVG